MMIQHNLAGQNANRNKGINNIRKNKSLEKLSTGYRINRAGDDAAGLAISEGMRNQIRGLDQALHNVNDGISMTNTGEGALQEVHSMLQRMKTLAIKSANGTYNSVARVSIDSERKQLVKEIDRICSTANFNDVKLFDSAENPPIPAPQSDQHIDLQIGYTNQEVMPIAQYYMGSQALELDGSSGKASDFLTQEHANEMVDVIDRAIDAVTKVRSSFGAAQNHLERTHNSLSVTNENMTVSESRIRDTNMAEEVTEFTSANVADQASLSMMSRANHMPEIVMQLLQG